MADSISEKNPVSKGRDVEEAAESSRVSTSDIHGEVDVTAIPEDEVTNKWQQFANKLTGLVGAEARGIERVDESLRTAKTPLKSYYDMAAIWFSVNLTVRFPPQSFVLTL